MLLRTFEITQCAHKTIVWTLFDSVSDPFQTVTFSVFGYAGCDTYLTYACPNFGRKFDFIICCCCIVLHLNFNIIKIIETQYIHVKLLTWYDFSFNDFKMQNILIAVAFITRFKVRLWILLNQLLDDILPYTLIYTVFIPLYIRVVNLINKIKSVTYEKGKLWLYEQTKSIIYFFIFNQLPNHSCFIVGTMWCVSKHVGLAHAALTIALWAI